MPIAGFEKIYNGNEEIGIRLLGTPRGDLEFLYADIPGNSWNQNRLDKFVQRANQFLEKRVPISSLPDDDPDKFTDPATPRMFWDGNDLVTMNVEVVSASWGADGLEVTVRRR